MATRGRNICNTLKTIRKQIADANGINYSPEECHFEGECKGTCPKCEQEVKDLEYELHLKEMAGKAIKVAGVALGITAIAASATSCATQKGYYNPIPPKPEKVIPIRYQEYTSSDSILLKEREELSKKGVLFVQGHLIDEEDKEPLIGASVIAKLSGKYAISDVNGNFTLEVKQGDTITVKYIGFQDRTIKLPEMSQDKLNIITLTLNESVLGEVIAGIADIAKPIHSKKLKQEKKDKHGSKTEQEFEAEQDMNIKQAKDAKQGIDTKPEKSASIHPAVTTDSTDNSKIFGAMEGMASFPGGSAACMKFIADNIRAPKECEESDAQGRVILGFTVNEDGSLSDIKVMRSITPYLDEEAIRVVKSMPKWNPAKQNGKPVKSKYTLPVTFCWQ